MDKKILLTLFMIMHILLCKMISWIKNHKLTSLLLIIVLFLVLKPANLISTKKMSTISPPNIAYDTGVNAPTAFKSAGVGGAEVVPEPNYAPTVASDRKVIQESNMSLLVKNVVDSRKKIVDYAQNNGGYMVNSDISNPQDAPTSTITVRISAKQLETALDFFRSLAVKVVSENLSGYDVTDQYTDVDKRIAILEKTKAKFEEILGQTKEVSDILNVNREIINIQSQIDSYKGQQDYLAKNAEMSKITVYLSTDEMALPYAPSETFRPGVIFKLAVRSLVGDLRSLAISVIWILVYAVIWVPALFIIRFIYKRFIKRTV